MPPKASAAGSWLGAPPVAEEGFAFANGEFFAEASGHNRHRRANQHELKEHFTSGNDKDHPAHWFEAQLIHYGLQPSKTKSVARMRLFDAVNAGSLKVPPNVSKLETKLKKEWTKNDREAKKSATSKPAAKPAPAAKVETKKTAASGTKRKASQDDDGSTTAKKPKTAAPKTKATAKAPAKAPGKESAKTSATAKTSTSASATAPAKKQTARCVRGGASQGVSRGASAASQGVSRGAASTAQPRKPRLKQTAPCTGRGGTSQGPSRGALRRSSPESSPAPRYATPQTARRSNAFAARGRIPAPTSGYDFDDAPPPYSEFPDQGDYSDEYSSNDSNHSDSNELRPLGLLNGDYEVESDDVTEQWSFFNDNFELTLTLAGSSMWGSFNLGVYEGVMFFDERPMKSSHERVWFKWRGREDQGPVIYGDNNEGWMQFLGDGRIEGWLDHQSLSFQCRRLPDQGTRSRIDARSLQSEWAGYSEDLYEQENQARW
ncbi:hypothetical protein FSARC_12484 [Fusarium sarcochroum]|uniref:Uncharacterized protein n=1 Tax=Fusarium sarcochroum TaxID=1208366 RepID=A0A8H4T825_9HYPO|nr:hypothetical protein FSARC_12484 [Fusarium sarcochroum]